MTFFRFILYVAAFCAVARAQYSGFSSPGYAYGGAAYLSLPLQAYAAGLAQSVTAWREGGGAGIQYNPALLDAVQSLSVTGSYSFIKDERSLKGADAAIPIGEWLVAAASFANAGVDNIEQRDDFGNFINAADPYFGYRENAVALAAAGRLRWNIAVGARVRYLNEFFKDLKGIDNTYANGMGFDAGATWEPDSHVCVGVSGLNIGSYLWWATGHRDIVLPQARAGVAGLFFHRSLIAEIDVAKTLRQPVDISGGIQYTILKIISVRGGIATSVDIKERHSRYPDYSVGAGVRYSFFGCDYALILPSSDISDMISHRISLVLRLPYMF
jgi:hypothetical protein